MLRGRRTDKDGQLGLGEVGLLVLRELVKLRLDVLLQLGDGVAKSRARVVDLVLHNGRGASEPCERGGKPGRKAQDDARR